MTSKSRRNRKANECGSSSARDLRDVKIRKSPGFCHHSLSVCFQPIFCTRNGNIYGYEALTRLRGDNPYASISELFSRVRGLHTITSLDSLCQENAVREAATVGINQRGDTHLFINIRAATFMSPVYGIEMISEFADRWGLSKDRIVLEIMEEGAIGNYDLFRRVVFSYKDEGYKIAIDDFGADYHGLKILSRIEPDFIKIDMHCLAGKDKEQFSLLNQVILTCHKVGIKVIVKYIERREELERVQGMDIEFLQGYYLGMPSL